MLENCTVDIAPINFEFNNQFGGSEDNLLLSEESGDEIKMRSVSEKKLIFTGFFGSIHYTDSLEVFETELPFVENFKFIFVLFH